MTQVHHLNCGTLRALPGDPNSISSCHCLLLEDEAGLVLIDTGLGVIEMQQPRERFGEQLMNTWGFTLDENLSALRQLQRRGLDPDRVKHIVLSHADIDHAGGLRDFPNATVHLSSEELANLEAKNARYVFNQFEHGPKWKAHGPTGEKWFGLDARDLPLGLSSRVKLIPLFGHTRGHCGIAVQQGSRWLLHAADTYYRRVELVAHDNAVTALSSHTADDNEQRIGALAAVRGLVAGHSKEVSVFSTHDVLEFPSSVFQKLLIVTTSHEWFLHEGQTVPTGVWLEEFAVPYRELFRAGIALTVASPKGGPMPIDPRSVTTQAQEVDWQSALAAAKNTRRLIEMDSRDFDGIFLPGGHGPMFDLPDNSDLIRLLGEFDRAGKIIGAICHGPAGLINARKASGEPLVAGRTVTAYTAAEEIAAGLDQAVPFNLEAELKRQGARFVDGGLKADHVERDGHLITGQNPASSARMAREIARALQQKT